MSEGPKISEADTSDAAQRYADAVGVLPDEKRRKAKGGPRRRLLPAPPSLLDQHAIAAGKRMGREVRESVGMIARKPLERERPVVDRAEVRQARAAVHRKIKTP